LQDFRRGVELTAREVMKEQKGNLSPNLEGIMSEFPQKSGAAPNAVKVNQGPSRSVKHRRWQNFFPGIYQPFFEIHSSEGPEPPVKVRQSR
jgi:hypothetical protein